MVLVGRIQMLSLLLGGRPVVHSAGLEHRVLIFIKDIRDPAVLVVEAEPERVDSVGEVLETHSGTVVVGDVVLEGDFPSITAPVETEQFPSPLVPDDIELVADSPRCGGPTGRYDPEIVAEVDWHRYSSAFAAPEGVMVQLKDEIKSLCELDVKAGPKPVEESSFHVAIIEGAVIAP